MIDKVDGNETSERHLEQHGDDARRRMAETEALLESQFGEDGQDARHRVQAQRQTGRPLDRPDPALVVQVIAQHRPLRSCSVADSDRQYFLFEKKDAPYRYRHTLLQFRDQRLIH